MQKRPECVEIVASLSERVDIVASLSISITLVTSPHEFSSEMAMLTKDVHCSRQVGWLTKCKQKMDTVPGKWMEEATCCTSGHMPRTAGPRSEILQSKANYLGVARLV